MSNSDRLASLRASILASKQRKKDAEESQELAAVEEKPAPTPPTHDGVVTAEFDYDSLEGDSEVDVAPETQVLPAGTDFSADTIQSEPDSATKDYIETPDALKPNVNDTATHDISDVLADVDAIANDAGASAGELPKNVDASTEMQMPADLDAIAHHDLLAQVDALAEPSEGDVAPHPDFSDDDGPRGSDTAQVDMDQVRANLEAMGTSVESGDAAGEHGDIMSGASVEEAEEHLAQARELGATDSEIGPDPTVQKSLSKLQSVEGAALYMSPERCTKATLEPASDVYSLGALLFELFEGTAPYLGTTDEEVIFKHLDAPVPEQESNQTPPAIKELISRMLSKMPHVRPSVDEVIEILQHEMAAIAGESAEQGIPFDAAVPDALEYTPDPTPQPYDEPETVGDAEPAAEEPEVAAAAVAPMVATPPDADHTLDSPSEKKGAMLIIGGLIGLALIALVAVGLSGSGDEPTPAEDPAVATGAEDPVQQDPVQQDPAEPAIDPEVPDEPVVAEPEVADEPDADSLEMAFGDEDAGEAADAALDPAVARVQPDVAEPEPEPEVAEPEPEPEPEPEVVAEPEPEPKPVKRKKRRKKKKKKPVELRMEL